MTWLAGISWFLVGLYGVFYNVSYIDEAKYLIKGWLMATGQVGYYSTPEFFYQHMPGGLLWFGTIQKWFGPSLLNARIQSLIISGLIFYLTFLLAKNLAGKIAGKLSLLILSLAPVAGLYYVSAVPQGMSVVVLLLAFLAVANKKYLWSSFWFALALIVRENFLFTLMLYFGFLVVQLKNLKELSKNLAVILLTLFIFFYPGWPGILKVFYNFPGISLILPLTGTVKEILGLNWQQQSHNINLYWLAVKEFGVIYFSLIISLLLGAVSLSKVKISAKIRPVFYLLIVVTCLNLLAHTWSAFQLSPRAIISYLAYVAPLLAVVGAVLLSSKVNIFLKFYPALLLLALFTLRFASITGHLNQPTNLQQINQSVESLQSLTAGKNHILWLAEPMPMYLAGKVSYYPLINHTNFFKPSTDTDTVSSLGFWNQAMMAEWLNQADLVVVSDDRLVQMSQNPLAQPAGQMINARLLQEFKPIILDAYIWPGNLRFFEK